MNINDFFSLIQFKISDAIDIMLVTFILFTLYKWVKGTPAVRIFFGLILLFLIWRVVIALQLNMVSEILGQFISIGLISLIIIFQPEIRNFLFYLGENQLLRWFQGKLSKKKIDESIRKEIDMIVTACQEMSTTYTGVLIIFAKKALLEEILETGEKLDALISKDLLENIFYKNSPLHDGAVIIKDSRIVAARCILPVSKDQSIPTHLGLRHRAAIGSTIMSDSVAVLVSEQTGAISFCQDGKIHYNVTPEELSEKLYQHITN